MRIKGLLENVFVGILIVDYVVGMSVLPKLYQLSSEGRYMDMFADMAIPTIIGGVAGATFGTLRDVVYRNRIDR